MQNKTDINKINNDYVLKSLFTYIDYQNILKIAKKNKRLQNRLGINIQNYKERSDFPKYEYYKRQIISRKRMGIGGQDIVEAFMIIISSCCTCILFIYSIIYSILLVSLGSFDDSNTKENYNKSSANIIKKINALTFILDGVAIATPFLFNIYIFKEIEMDYGLKRFFKSFILIIINLAHFSFEGFIIWKLVLSYRIKKGGVTWFMVMDYIFLILNFIYILYILFFSLGYFSDSGMAIKKEKIFALNSFNGIPINDYILPDNFDKWKKKNRKEYVLKNYYKYKYEISRSQERVLDSINNFRIIKGMKRLEVDTKNRIPEFIINKPIELLLNSKQNIFKLSNTQYLFKYPKGIFEKEFNKGNENIINILLNNNLNYIQIINEGDYQYIMVSNYLFSNHYRNRFNSPFEDDLYRYKEVKESDENNLNYDYRLIINSIDKEYFE